MTKLKTLNLSDMNLDPLDFTYIEVTSKVSF